MSQTCLTLVYIPRPMHVPDLSYTGARLNVDAISQTWSYTGSHVEADAMSQAWSYTGSHNVALAMS